MKRGVHPIESTKAGVVQGGTLSASLLIDGAYCGCASTWVPDGNTTYRVVNTPWVPTVFGIGPEVPVLTRTVGIGSVFALIQSMLPVVSEAIEFGPRA